MSSTSLVMRWLEAAVNQGASDLHLVAGHPPTVRLDGNLLAIEKQPVDDKPLRAGLFALCSADQQNEFTQRKNLDLAAQLAISGTLRRFRANYFLSGDLMGACFRVIPEHIPDFQWAGFPYELADRLAHQRNGLVLVCGVTGAGKTTTLAMIVHMLNKEAGYRIITVEDPIEYVFPQQVDSIVTQREVGRDVATFADGLRFGLRQDPDVILVGEIRDQETAQIALSAAETGHLVFSTLHTRDAKGAISRFTDLFPPPIQSQVRSQLSMSLRAVISQHLLPSARGGKRRLALEVLVNTNAIASAIRFGKLESIDTGIVTGRADGMVSLDESLKRLLENGEISREVAMRNISDPVLLRR